ncbi:MAG: hypothetical protein MI974_12735 [Chitinophagales bacterium]|nr:hypothetical protein [Chitinophagales bacterium]
MKRKLPFDRIPIKSLMFVASSIVISLLAGMLATNYYHWAEALFYVCLVVIMLTMIVRVEIIREDQANSRKYDERVQSKLDDFDEKLNALHLKLDNFNQTLKVISNFKFEVVDRSKVSSKESYARISKIIHRAKESIKIISPRKTEWYKDASRRRYFSDFEKCIHAKLKRNKNFIYRRIIPVSAKEFANKKYDWLDTNLLDHCTHISQKLKKYPAVGCRIVNELNVPMNFIMVDSTYLIVLFPRLVDKGQDIFKDNECDFHIIIKDNDKSFIRSLERQFRVLYNNGSIVYSQLNNAQ